MSEPGIESVLDSEGVAVIRCNDLVVASRYEAMLRAHKLDSLDALFDVRGAELLSKPGLSPWRERLRLTVPDGDDTHTFYLKRFRRPPPKARRSLQAVERGASSLAGIEWAWVNRLTRDGIACAFPIAFGEELHGSREIRSAILTAAVPGRSLEKWVSTWGEANRAVVASLLSPLAVLISRLHRLGYVHRDLYLSHVFWDPDLPLESSLFLIDLQRVMRPGWRRRRWIVKDLAALNFSAPVDVVSATDRVRWLKRYLGMSKLDASAKRLAYRVVGKTLSIARHEERRRALFRRRSGPQ